MKYPQYGIPTMYNGINFRSRLEATWARFFDLCGWRWEYEPFDLEGYIPDFVLHGTAPILVDVKPLVLEDELEDRALELESTWCGLGYEVLVVGSGFIESDFLHAPAIGVLGSPTGPDGEHCYGTASLFQCTECGVISFLHDPMSWHSRFCEHYDGNHYLGMFKDADSFWAVAKNGAQWKAVKPVEWRTDA